MIYGSGAKEAFAGALVDDLARHGLIDEYRLMVYPVVVGVGKRLFSAAAGMTLRLTHTTTTSAGVVVLTYTSTAAGA